MKTEVILSFGIFTPYMPDIEPPSMVKYSELFANEALVSCLFRPMIRVLLSGDVFEIDLPRELTGTFNYGDMVRRLVPAPIPTGSQTKSQLYRS